MIELKDLDLNKFLAEDEDGDDDDASFVEMETSINTTNLSIFFNKKIIY
jgi:hypothetical protein